MHLRECKDMEKIIRPSMCFEKSNYINYSVDGNVMSVLDGAKNYQNQ